MEIVRVAAEIEKKIATLEKGRALLQERATNKANSIAEYEKALAKTLIKLRNGVAFDWDGEKIKDPPASYTERIAKGLCYKEKIAMDLAESEYKNAIEGLRCIESELNGWQSINRYLQDK